MSEANEIDELDAELNSYDDLIEAEKQLRHQHKKGYVGASAGADCIYWTACKRAGIPMPPLEGLKSFNGPARQGTKEHELESAKIDKLNEIKPLTDGRTRGHDLMVEVPISDEITVESEIDLAYIKGSVEKVPWQFKNTVQDTYQLTEGSEFVEIYDIKTKSGMSFWKYVALAKEGKFPRKWKIQFADYLKGTGKDHIKVRIVDRDMGNTATFTIFWDEETWQWHTDHEIAIERMTEALLNNPEEVHVSVDDLEFFDPDPIEVSAEEETASTPKFAKCWTYCNWSKCHTEYDKNGRPKTVLDEICPPAHNILVQTARMFYHVGGQYCRGQSKITILKIDDNAQIIYSQNKSGTEYQDTYDAAVASFHSIDDWKPIEEKKQK